MIRYTQSGYHCFGFQTYVHKVSLSFKSVCLALRVLPLIPHVEFISRYSIFYLYRAPGIGLVPVSGTVRFHAVFGLFVLYRYLNGYALWQGALVDLWFDVLAFMVSTVTLIRITMLVQGPVTCLALNSACCQLQFVSSPPQSLFPYLNSRGNGPRGWDGWKMPHAYHTILP